YHLAVLALAACGGGAGSDPQPGMSPPTLDTPPPQAPVMGSGDGGSGPMASAPGPSCDARDFGAKGDGRTKTTAATQAAIDARADKNGTVYLRNGTFLSGMIRLKSAMTLYIDVSATLKGTQDDADYPTQNPPTTNTQLLNCRKSLVYAES